MSDHAITLEVDLAAPAERVWRALTVASEMQRWMGDEEMPIEVVLEPVLGGRAVFRATHEMPIEARGVVVALVPCERLAYTHLADISALPELAESYATLDFSLARIEPRATRLTLHLVGAPTESIEKHLVLYWRASLEMLRRHVEAHDGA